MKLFLTIFCAVLFLSLGITGMATATNSRKAITEELVSSQALLSEGRYDEAFKSYLFFAEKGNPLAQFTVGLFHRLGWGRPKNAEAACQWFSKAGSENIPTAAHFFADCLEQGTGQPRDLKAAAQWYEKAAGLGYHLSLLNLARMYMHGQGVLQDTQKALELCREAAGRQVVAAQVQMGHWLMGRQYGVQDLEGAFKWFTHAAARESSEAQYYIGVLLKNGMGRAEDLSSARYWFEKAAANGYEKAYIEAGTLYWMSPVDPETRKLDAKDLAKSYLWLSAAARLNHNATEEQSAKILLEKVLAMMPEEWKPELDQKIDQHFKTFHNKKI